MSMLQSRPSKLPAAARKPRRAPKPPKPVALVDLLDRYPVLDRQDERWHGVVRVGGPITVGELAEEGKPLDRAGQAMLGEVREMAGQSKPIRTPARPAIRGRELLAWLEAGPVPVSFVLATDGRLGIATAGGALAEDRRRIIEAAAPLLRGYVAAEPLTCAFHHGKGPAPEAVSLAEPSRAPACPAHLAGELAP